MRELSDGRVLVLDQEDGVLYMLDAGLRVLRVVLRRGGGPNEMPSPYRLFALTGDSSAVLDNTTQRLTVLSADGVIVRQARGDGCPGPQSVRIRQVAATDGQGRYYTEALLPMGAAQESVAARAPIVRWTERCGIDTVAWVPLPRDGELVPVGNGVTLRQQAPFAARSQWAVTRDGAVVVVDPDPYQVMFYRDGAVTLRGPEIPFSPIRVTEALRQEWREAQAAPQRVMTVGRDRTVSMTRRTVPYAEPRNWPRVLPPFLPGAVRLSPTGVVWVQRTVPAGDPLLFDLIGVDGAVTLRVQLPRGSRLAGIGHAGAYVIQHTEDGGERLVRFAVPLPSSR